ncbi:unnamed protein product, partial [Urochloa humidicola]
FLLLSCSLLALSVRHCRSRRRCTTLGLPLSPLALSPPQWVTPPVKQQQQRARPRGGRPPFKQRRQGRDPAPAAAAEAGSGAGSLASLRKPARAAAVPRAEDTTADGGGGRGGRIWERAGRGGRGFGGRAGRELGDDGANLERESKSSPARALDPCLRRLPAAASYSALRAVATSWEHEPHSSTNETTTRSTLGSWRGFRAKKSCMSTDDYGALYVP